MLLACVLNCSDMPSLRSVLLLLCNEQTGMRLCLQELCPTVAPGTKIVINLSGRGDKDVHTAAQHLDISGEM